MPGEHEDKDTPPAGLDAQETMRVEALSTAPGLPDDPDAQIDFHRRAAARLLKEGSPGRAFGELVKASRAIPMTRRLAAALVAVARRAGTEPAAVTLLTSGVEENDGLVRIDIRRQLGRLFRKTGDLERAREALVLILAEKPGDRRARRVLNALLEREERWEELDASLEKEAKEAFKRGSLRRAARAALSRARMWGEKLKNHAHAAVRYGQASEFLEQARDFEAAFTVRLLWVRALREAQASSGVLKDAVDRCLNAGDRVGKEHRARALLREMGLLPGAATPLPTSDRVKTAGRRNTQRELLAAAAEADAEGKKPEAAALYSAAVAEAPDPETLKRLEAHYVARGAWRELASFYRDRASVVEDKAEQAELLAKMAELLEDELSDPAAAARAYGEIVQLTGDERALKEQVRLLSDRQDFSGVQRALDLAVQSATTDEAALSSLVARGEASMARRELGKARRDFEQALKVAPSHLGALAGLAEAVAERGEKAPAVALKAALAQLPRRQPERAGYLRRLARLADAPLKDAELARWAWTEVLAESPQDAGAQRRLAVLARKAGDGDKLDQLLKAQLDREPRGPKSREAWRERASLADKAGKPEEALELLRQAVRAEPGHKEAWLMLADRLAARGKNGEAAWAYEQAATATEDEAERQQAWARLSKFARDVLKDAPKAALFAMRAENLRQALDEAAQAQQGPPSRPPSPPLGRALMPTTDPAVPVTPEALLGAGGEGGALAEVITDPGQLVGEDDFEPPPVERPAAIREPQRKAEPVDTQDAATGKQQMFPARRPEPPRPPPPVLEPVGPPLKRRTQELPAAAGADDDDPEPTWGGAYPTQLQERLFGQVHAQPLDPAAYQALAGYFQDLGDAERGGLMEEISFALEGDPAAAPRAPKLMLSAADRSSLRHPLLRGQEGELLSAVGVALCRLYGPPEGADGGEEFRVDAGRGAPAAAEALQAAVRILGLRAPEVFISTESGPPFSLDFQRTPMLRVGRQAVERQLPDAELRFFAGRALFAQNPDLLALRQLSVDQLDEGLRLLEVALRDGKEKDPRVRQLREMLPRKAMEGLRRLQEEVREVLDLELLAEGARHSANRAGLVVCGGVAPALAALRAREPEEELMELVRFSASERYLKLRQRRLG